MSPDLLYRWVTVRWWEHDRNTCITSVCVYKIQQSAECEETPRVRRSHTKCLKISIFIERVRK